MSKKSKTIIAILLLVIGGGLIPTGMILNDTMRSEVYDGVPDALLGIRAQAIPTIEETIPILGTPEVLKGIFDEASAGVEPLLKVKSTPDSLLGLKANINASIPDLINFATTAQLIATSFDWMNTTYGFDVGTDIFFNDPTFVDPFTGLLGVSNMTGVSQGYTLAARTNLLLNTIHDDYIDPFDFHGLITDLTTGSGVGEIYNIFYYMGILGGDVYTNVALPAAYNITLAQVTDIFNYLWTIITYYVPGAFSYAYGISTAEAAATGFYRQWANGTFVPDGINIGGGLKGFEVGVPEPTNISVSTCIDLWNPLLPYTFVTEAGLMAWLGAAAGDTGLQTLLMSTFSLTPTQLNMLLTWLGNFIENITPALVLGSTGKTVSELATLAFFEQWANGTIFGEVVLPDGFLGEVTSSWAGAPYFEVGLPTASGLSLYECISLWNPLGDKTFIYGESFENLWLPAMQGNSTSQGTLIAIFGISPGELTAILTWIGSLIGLDPTAGRIADIIEYNTGFTVLQIATSYFYDQWANGTVEGEDFLPEGFLSQLDPPIEGPPYFEVGLFYPTGITIAQTLALWDETSEYSLVTESGIYKWYQAVEGNLNYTTLKEQNGDLSDLQMTGLLAWLPQFRDVIVNKLAKADMGLPQEPYELGQTLALSLGIAGGILAALGVIVLLLARRSF
ncbi:MAG: hypothetical protein HWN79_05230 [Candidatus Lokiarchaeota archaeon]|nr:hypothetical protein [Candidatus Lokiarchaeota archaeon]